MQGEPPWPGSGSQVRLPELAAASADTMKNPTPVGGRGRVGRGKGGGQGRRATHCSYPGGLGGASAPSPNRAFVGEVRGLGASGPGH